MMLFLIFELLIMLRAAFCRCRSVAALGQDKCLNHWRVLMLCLLCLQGCCAGRWWALPWRSRTGGGLRCADAEGGGSEGQH